MNYADTKLITLSRNASRDHTVRQYTQAQIRAVDIGQGRMRLTEDEFNGIVELIAATWMLEDAAQRSKRYLKKFKFYRRVRQAYGLAHYVTSNGMDSISTEQLIPMCNALSTSDIHITADKSNVPIDMTAVETTQLKLIAAEAVKQCAASCCKTRKQAKHCPIRKALMLVPGIADAAASNPFADTEHCLFSQVGGDYDDNIGETAAD